MRLSGLGAVPAPDSLTEQNIGGLLQTMTMDEILVLWDQLLQLMQVPYSDPWHAKSRRLLNDFVVPYFQQMQAAQDAVIAATPGVDYAQSITIPEIRAQFDPVAAERMTSPDAAVRGAQIESDAQLAEQRADNIAQIQENTVQTLGPMVLQPTSPMKPVIGIGLLSLLSLLF